MAININDKYPGQTSGITVGYPYGKARNNLQEDDGTGTPYEQDLINDTVGFHQALLSEVGAVPSGLPDSVGASQYLDAIKTLSFGHEYRPDKFSGYMSDPAAAINASINEAAAAGGGTVIIPDRPSYSTTIASTLTLKSNVKLKVYGELDLTVPGGLAITAAGTSAGQIAIASAITNYSNIIDTVSPHGLVIGDLVRVLGQRNALSVDAEASGYRLGYGGSSYCYFGEFVTVKDVVSPTQFKVSKPLIFPDYLNTDSSETDPNARTSTTVEKITPVRNVLLDFSNARLVHSGGFQDIVRPSYARDWTVVGGEYDKGDKTGAVAFWVDSYNCRIVRPVIKHDDDTNIDVASNKDNYNTLKTAGSDNCDFLDVYSENGSQVVDYSFFNGGKCSVGGVTTILNAVNNRATVTTHQGTYGMSFPYMRISTHQGGFSNRAKGTSFGELHLTGMENADLNPVGFGRNGFNAYQRGATDFTLGQVHARGFRHAVSVSDAAGTSEEKFDKVKGNIGIITSVECDYTFVMDRSGTYTHDIPSGLVIGQILSDRTKEAVVSIQEHFHSVDIRFVKVTDFQGTNKNIFEGTANCTGVRFGKVVLENCGISNNVYDFPRVTDTVTMTDGKNHHELPIPTVVGDIGNMWANNADTVSPYGFSCQEAATDSTTLSPCFSNYAQFGLNNTNQYFGAYNWYSNDSTLTDGNVLVGQVVAEAKQTHGGTAAGTDIAVFATPTGSVTPIKVATFGDNNSTDQLAMLASEGVLGVRNNLSGVATTNALYNQVYSASDSTLNVFTSSGVSERIAHGATGASIANPTGGVMADDEARAAINDIIDALQSFGIIS